MPSEPVATLRASESRSVAGGQSEREEPGGEPFRSRRSPTTIAFRMHRSLRAAANLAAGIGWLAIILVVGFIVSLILYFLLGGKAAGL